MLSLAFPVPRGAFAQDLVITLDLPDAVSPATLGVSPDPRVLGVAVDSLMLWPAPREIGPPIVRPPLPARHRHLSHRQRRIIPYRKRPLRQHDGKFRFLDSRGTASSQSEAQHQGQDAISHV